MNSDMSWIMNYGSSLRKKEENFDNLCFESSQPAVEYNEEGSQDSNNVETKVKPSSVHRETVASTMPPVNPGLLEKQQRCSSNPMSIHPRTQTNYIKEKDPSRGQNLEKKFLDDRRREDIPLKRSSSSMSTSTPWWKWKEKKREQASGCHTSSIENRKKITGEGVHVWRLVALPLPQKLQSKVWNL